MAATALGKFISFSLGRARQNRNRPPAAAYAPAFVGNAPGVNIAHRLNSQSARCVDWAGDGIGDKILDEGCAENGGLTEIANRSRNPRIGGAGWNDGL